MINIKSRGKIIQAPSCADELNEEQYLYLLMLLMAAGSGIDPDYIKIRMLSYFAGLGDLDYTSLQAPYAEELAAQTHLLSGFFVSDGESERLSLGTSKNLLKKFKIGNVEYKGPEDWLNGVTFGEFTECTAVAATDYDHLTRVLYHIPEDVEVPALLALHALIMFSHVWKTITTTPIEINGNLIDFGIIFKADGAHQKADDHTGWTGITFEIASSGVFGNIKETESADMWLVLLYLYKCKFEAMHENKN